jgi:hypothetical protein
MLHGGASIYAGNEGGWFAGWRHIGGASWCSGICYRCGMRRETGKKKDLDRMDSAKLYIFFIVNKNIVFFSRIN